jgi:hypothetical protein
MVKSPEEIVDNAEKLFNYVLIQTKDPKLTESICKVLLKDLSEQELPKLKTQADKLMLMKAVMKRG